jgi:hypothetical protein
MSLRARAVLKATAPAKRESQTPIITLAVTGRPGGHLESDAITSRFRPPRRRQRRLRSARSHARPSAQRGCGWTSPAHQSAPAISPARRSRAVKDRPQTRTSGSTCRHIKSGGRLRRGLERLLAGQELSRALYNRRSDLQIAIGANEGSRSEIVLPRLFSRCSARLADGRGRSAASRILPGPAQNLLDRGIHASRVLS